MITEHKVNYYIGTIIAVVDNVTEKPKPGGKPIDDLLKDHKSQEHIAIATIPGIAEYVKIYPSRNQIDEPKIKDLAIIAVWDPAYLSYCTYEKLKENDFVGFRAHGKMIDITHEKITVGVFDESIEYVDEERPDVKPLAQVDLTKDGEIYVHAAKDITVDTDANVTINIKGNSTVNIDGNSEVNIKGNSEIDVKGSTELSCPDVTITGGKLTVGGTCSVTGQGGFCGLPACLLTNAPHVGHIISNT